MNARTILCFALLILATSSVYGQTASKVGNVYQIPFATAGNRIDLAVANVGEGGMSSVKVVPVQKPGWLRLDTDEVMLSHLNAEEDGIASFGFSVDREAPIGERASLRFDIIAGGKIIGAKEFVLAVEAPTEAALDQNFPNPFSQSTTIGFDVPGAGAVKMGIYDMLGRQVSVLLDEQKAAGHHKVQWDASGLASGMYFCIMKTHSEDGRAQLLRNKMVVVR